MLKTLTPQQIQQAIKNTERPAINRSPAAHEALLNHKKSPAPARPSKFLHHKGYIWNESYPKYTEK